MDRADLVRVEIVDTTLELPGPYTICERSDERWLVRHPSGFGVADRDAIFGFSTTRIIQTCQHLNDVDFLYCLQAIYDWWMAVALCSDNFNDALAFLKDRAPDSLHQLTSHPMLLDQRYTLQEWLVGKEPT